MDSWDFFFLAIICFITFLLCCLSSEKGVPRYYPIVGMLPELLLNVHRSHDWCTEYLAKSQCSFLFKGPWFANMDMFFTVDPANAHYILSKNFSNFPKGPEFKEIFDPLGDGIFNSDSDSWKNQRRFAQAMMKHHSFYKFLVKTSQDKVENGQIPVLKYVREQEITVDLQDLSQRFTFESTCLLVTGYDPACLSPDFPEVLFCRSLEEGEEAVFYRHVVPESVWKLQRWLGIGQERKLKKAREIVDRVLFDYVQRKRTETKKKENLQNLQKQEVEGVDFLTSYMDENKAMAANLNSEDDNFLRDSILNFMLAGRDTTSSALTWFCWLLSNNPKAETRIREELKSIIPGENFGKWYQFDIQELGNLVYLHGAFCEALRLFPPVPFQHKSPLAPDVLPSGHRVKPKTKILLSLYAMGRMKSVWGEDCLEFKPERWISENGGIKREPSYKFLSFNAGPRTCLGKEVAFTQMKMAAAAIIHNFELQVEEGQKVGPNVSLVLQMKEGLRVRVKDRWGE